MGTLRQLISNNKHTPWRDSINPYSTGCHPLNMQGYNTKKAYWSSNLATAAFKLMPSCTAAPLIVQCIGSNRRHLFLVLTVAFVLIKASIKAEVLLTTSAFQTVTKMLLFCAMSRRLHKSTLIQWLTQRTFSMLGYRRGRSMLGYRKRKKHAGVQALHHYMRQPRPCHLLDMCNELQHHSFKQCLLLGWSMFPCASVYPRLAYSTLDSNTTYHARVLVYKGTEKSCSWSISYHELGTLGDLHEVSSSLVKSRAAAPELHLNLWLQLTTRQRACTLEPVSMTPQICQETDLDQAIWADVSGRASASLF